MRLMASIPFLLKFVGFVFNIKVLYLPPYIIIRAFNIWTFFVNPCGAIIFIFENIRFFGLKSY